MLGSKMHEGRGTVVRKLSFLFNGLDFCLISQLQSSPIEANFSQFMFFLVIHNMVRGVRETRGTQRIRLSRICPRDLGLQGPGFRIRSSKVVQSSWGGWLVGRRGRCSGGSRGRGRRL